MAAHDNIHHPIDKILDGSEVKSMYSRRQSVTVGGRRYPMRAFRKMLKADILALGLKLFTNVYIDREFYTYSGESDSEVDGVVTRTETGTESQALADLRIFMEKSAEGQLIVLLNSVDQSQTTFNRAGKATWNTTMNTYWTSILSAWTGTIRAEFRDAGNTYADLIAYWRVWRDDIPAWPTGIPKPANVEV